MEMSFKSEKDRARQIQDKCQSLLTSMLRDEDNKYCVDCDSKGPRWASWNLGVFLCIRCAGIHRNLGVHISRVKSVNLDTWTPEQVVSLQQMGNSRARAVYEALLPDGFRRPQTDSSLEAFVRAKYEQKKYLAREWVQPPTPKVDWDKEIEEELEKQKKKKKVNSTSVISVVPKSKLDIVPQPLPKSTIQKNFSPKSGKSKEQNDSADLLELNSKADDFSDNFNSFLAAEPFKTDSKPVEKADPLKVEEDNFFNQPVPSEKEKAKLTKDSILALYDTAPINSAQPQTNSMTFNNYSVPVTKSFTQVQSNAFPSQLVFPMNAANQYNQQNFMQQCSSQQLPLQQQNNAFQQMLPAQLHHTSFAQNSNTSYAQRNPVHCQQNGYNIANNQFSLNSSGLVQDIFVENNAMHGTSNGMTSGQNFGQMNQYLGLAQQFGTMGLDSQNLFNNTSNI